MPWYDYKCPKCGHEELDVRRRIIEDVMIMECPECKEEMNQVLSKDAGKFKLQGGGWAKEGYNKTSKKS